MVCNSTLGNLSDEWFITFGVIMVIISVSGTFQNLLVIFILLKDKDLSSPSFKILRSLAVADFLTSLIVAPLHCMQYFDREILFHDCTVESMRRFLSTVFIGASAFTVGFISCERCILLKRANYTMPKKWMYTGIALCWLIPIILTFLRFLSTAEKVYSASIITSGILILVTIFTAYIAIIVALHMNSRRSLTNSGSERDRRIVITVIIIISFYILMLMPIFIHHGLNSYKACSAGCLTKTYNVGQVLAIGNSAVNPLIYFLRSSKMRESAGKIIGEITKRCRFGASLDSHQMSQRSIETNVDADDYQFSHQSAEESNCEM